jgi:hypothetical protein
MDTSAPVNTDGVNTQSRVDAIVEFNEFYNVLHLNNPDHSESICARNAARVMSGRHTSIDRNIAIFIDYCMFNTFGNCMWSEFEFTPVGSIVTRNDGSQLIITDAFGFTCNVDLI